MTRDDAKARILACLARGPAAGHTIAREALRMSTWEKSAARAELLAELIESGQVVEFVRPGGHMGRPQRHYALAGTVPAGKISRTAAGRPIGET